MINAVSRIKDKNFILNIFGDGSEKEKLLKLIKKKKLQKKIIYFKPLPFKKLRKFLFLTDATILFLKKGTALSNTLPAKIQTYISFGKPIIVSSDGEAKNFIKIHNLGYSSLAENDKDLSKIILKSIKISKLKREKIFKNSKKIFYKKMELNKWTHSLENIFDEIIKKR